MEAPRKHERFGDEIDWNVHINQVLSEKNIFYQLNSKWVLIADKIKKNTLTGYTGNPSIVDCGCHIGRWSELLKQAGFNYTGVDQSEQIIETAKNLHPETNFIEKFLWDMEYDKEFDCALCVAVLQHNQLSEKLKIIPSIFKALKPGGVFLFMESTVTTETNTQLTYDGWISMLTSFGFEFLESWHKNELGFDDNYLFRKPVEV
jgi:2-polyprenyl-3-methyl-5-hydroxy-6-metoxy-1,4-benzoquinol methylase